MLQPANADGKIKPFRNQIHKAVVQIQLDFHLRIAQLIACHHRSNGAGAEIQRSADAQQTRRGPFHIFYAFIRFTQLGQRQLALAIVTFSGLRQVLAAGVALQQTGIQHRFQLADMFADHHRGDVQPPRGFAKVAALHGADKGFDAA